MGVYAQLTCLACGEPLPEDKQRYCSAPCKWRAGRVRRRLRKQQPERRAAA